MEDEDIAVLGEFEPAGGHGRGGLVGNAVGCAFEEDGERTGLIDWGNNDGLELDAVAHGDHVFGEGEDGLRAGSRRRCLG